VSAFCTLRSLFEVLTGEPTLTVSKDANVIFGKNANVEILGGFEIQSGGFVNVQGKSCRAKRGNLRKKEPPRLALPGWFLVYLAALSVISSALSRTAKPSFNCSSVMINGGMINTVCQWVYR
jgi:hypothetical protein